MKEITFEAYKGYLNEWVDGKYVTNVPKGKRLVLTSNGKYYLADKVDKFVVKDKKKK
jgi:hypothetical protein